jgi:ribosomal protein L11 methyltransferase
VGATEWVEVVVPVGAADVDDIAALIASEIPAAAAGTEQRGDEVVFWVDSADSAAALETTRDAVARWQAQGAAVDAAKVRLSTALPEAEWRDAWKKYFKVSHLTRQFVVVPSWERYVAHDSEVVIDLDPGMAFGTGTHASTRLVLEELQELADRDVTPARILDVGCGSGILAIAAVKRWTDATCLAVDNDQLAVDATLDNASVNRVADRIESSLVPLSSLTETFPLVLANIQAHVLRELRSDLITHLAPGGTLILSGLLTPQAQPIADEFVAGGVRLVRIRASTDDPQWSSVTLRR